MPSLCSNLVTRIPDRFELVRPKRGNSNEGGQHIGRIAYDDSLSPALLPRLYGEEGKGKRDCAAQNSIREK